MGQEFAQVDVDELGEEQHWSRDDLPARPIELFEELCAQIRRSSYNISALLVAPLAFSPTLDPSDPDITGLLSKRWAGREVPGLYIIADDSALGWNGTEEYRPPSPRRRWRRFRRRTTAAGGQRQRSLRGGSTSSGVPKLPRVIQIDVYGHPVTRRRSGNHTPIIWDLGP